MAWLKQIIDSFAAAVIAVLPTSPFQPYIQQFSNLPYLGYLNWFLPVGQCITIGTAWLVAVGLFYLYSIIMRWVKMIGD